jgi:hypothetical protein
MRSPRGGPAREDVVILPGDTVPPPGRSPLTGATTASLVGLGRSPD